MGWLWKLLLVICAVICLVEGFQYPLQYHYHYRARLVSHLPEISEGNSSASEIKADLMVYATSANSVTFKLENVEVADYHGNVDNCQTDGELPVEYRVLQYDEPGFLIGQNPFTANRDELIFQEENPLWLKNFYKSIVGIFSTQPVRKISFGMDTLHGIGEESYKQREESVMGVCDAIYTQFLLDGVALNEHKHFVNNHITEDVQLDEPESGNSKSGRKTTGRKTGRKSPPAKGVKVPPRSQPLSQVPSINSTVWQVMRSIDLGECESRVEHQHSLSGVDCSLAKEQCENSLSRNSHGVYFIRGDSSGVRLEKAIIRGAIVVNPFGFETEMIQSNSLQKLSLVSVKTLGSNFPTVSNPSPATSLMYRMILPYEQLRNPYSSWSNFGTLRDSLEQINARPITAEMHQLHQDKSLQLVKAAYEAATNLGDTESGDDAPFLLKNAAQLLYHFNKEELIAVKTEAAKIFNSGELDLLGGVFAHIGTAEAVEILIDSFSKGEISPFHEAFIFGTLQKNMKSAKALKFLLTYLKSTGLDSTPFKSSHSLVNFASLVNTLCAQSLPGSFGEIAKLQCSTDNIVEDLETYLIENLKSADKFWKQMVIVRSLVNLKTNRTREALKPYILGQVPVDSMVRITAMQSLTSWNAPFGADGEETSLMLLKLFENPREKVRIRAKALSFLVSWNLCSTMWSRLAFTTKRPLLQDLAAFTYSIIESTANYKHPRTIKQAANAGHALRLARKFSPYKRYSGFKNWFEYNFETKISSFEHMEKLVSPLSPLPADISILMRRDLGGGIYMYKKLDAMIKNDWGDIETMTHDLFQGKPLSYQDHASGTGQWDSFIRMLKSGLDIDERVRGRLRGMLDFVPINDMQFFIPLETEYLQDMMRTASLGELFGSANHSLLYYNSIDVNFVTVNDIGLPAILSISKPNVWSASGYGWAYQNTNDQFKIGSENSTFKYESEFDTNFQTMALWSGQRLISGVTQRVQINQPFDVNAHLILSTSRERTTGVSITLTRGAATDLMYLDLASAGNVPYTTAVDTDLSRGNSMSPYNYPVLEKKIHDESIPLADGLKLKYTINSPTPFTELISKKMEPLFTSKIWMMSLNMNLQSRENMRFNFNFTRTHLDLDKDHVKFVSKYGQDSYSEDELCGAVKDVFTQQTGQTAADYYDYTQQNSSSQDIEEFGFGEQQSVQTPQTSEKLQDWDNSDAEINRPSFGAPDATSSILTSYIPTLRQQKGWNEKIWGYSLRYEFDEDATDAESGNAGELALMMTICDKIKDQRKLNFLFVAGKGNSPCETVCGDGEMKYPKVSDMDTLTTLNQKDLSKIMSYKAYVGEKCRIGPYFEFNDTRTITEEDIKKVTDSSIDCEFKSNDPVDEFSVAALYSTMDYSMKYNKKLLESSCSSSFLPLFKKAYNQLVSFSHAESGFDLCVANSEEITEFTSSLERWEDNIFRGSFNATMASGSVVTQEAQMAFPPWAENGINQVASSMLTEYEPSDYCVINETSLITFDGMQTSIQVDDCPLLAVTNCESGSKDSFAIGVSKSTNGGLSVNIASRFKQTVINMDSQGVQVNGKPMSDQEYVMDIIDDKDSYRHKLVGHVYRRNGFYKVELKDLLSEIRKDSLSVILKDGAAYIKTDSRYNGYLCGLCGNHNNEKVDDMKQPNGCLLTDAEKFRKAWIPSSSFQCFSSAEESTETCITAQNLI